MDKFSQEGDLAESPSLFLGDFFFTAPICMGVYPLSHCGSQLCFYELFRGKGKVV